MKWFPLIYHSASRHGWWVTSGNPLEKLWLPELFRMKRDRWWRWCFLSVSQIYIFHFNQESRCISKNTFKSWMVLVTQGKQTIVLVQASWCYTLSHLRGEEGEKPQKANYLGVQIFFSSVNFLWFSALHSTSASHRQEWMLGSFVGDPFHQYKNCITAAALALRLVPKVFSLELFFSLKEAGNENHRMKESHRDLFFCKCVRWNLGKQELKDDLTLFLVILNWHWRNSQGEGVLMETIIINLAVKWRKQVSLGCGSGSNRRLLSNSWISAPGEMSAGCWFPLLQQLCMNWLPQETRVGMWLVVPQPYGTRKRKSLVWSHPGTWLKVLGGQPGSLDQTFVISSRCFQTKKKKSVFLWLWGFVVFF